MRFDLENSCFVDGTSTIQLIAILRTVSLGRHRIRIVDEASRDYCNWCERQSNEIADLLELSVEESYTREALHPSRTRFSVYGVNRVRPGGIDAQLAATVSSFPFHIFVENAVSDRDFFLCFCSPEQRERILFLEEHRLLRFEHCGGIGEMPRILREFNSRHPFASQFCFAIFDSDSTRRDAPSEQSERVRLECDFLNIPHLQLPRRMIENYLPKFALHHWSHAANRSIRTRLIAVFNEFLGLSDEQSRHFNLKSGLRSDRREDGALPELFNALPDITKARLNHGFGANVGSLFGMQGTIRPKDLHKEGSWDEINPSVNEIVVLAR